VIERQRLTADLRGSEKPETITTEDTKEDRGIEQNLLIAKDAKGAKENRKAKAYCGFTRMSADQEIGAKRQEEWVRLRLIWIVRLPAAPLAHDDSLLRGDCCAARLQEKPLLPRGQEGCVWLEKVTELTVAAASGPADQWCWAE
jgi:hypothetical protein